jgi:hypothetical protein
VQCVVLVLGNEETSEARIQANLPEKSNQRVKQRKLRSGNEF